MMTNRQSLTSSPRTPTPPLLIVVYAYKLSHIVGRGYHIIQPIWCTEPLENIKNGQLTKLEPNPSNKFLQFAERYLSLDKSDSSHNPAIKSCLLRVPGSKNSKCKDMELDPEVKIIQKWNGHRPHYKLLFGRFYADLVGKKNNNSNKKTTITNSTTKTTTQQPTTIAWIERLLQQTPLSDYRKHSRDLIIIPYLVVCKGLTDRDEIYDVVMNWADKCNELRKLEPSRREFSIRIRSRIEEVMRDRIPPMTLDTLKQKCPELYETIRVGGAHNNR